jgi:hypothetical protein
MSTTETENGAASQYVPFTPFQESYAFEPESASAASFETGPMVTPFVSEYVGVEPHAPQAGELRDLLFELYDEQFDEVLGELAHEAWEAVAQRTEPFGEVGTTQSAEQFLREWSEPVRQAAETMLENIAQAASEHNLESMSESEVDGFFEQFEPRATGLEAHFENFLSGLWNKAKSFAKKALDVAKKGLTMLPGIGMLIGKLKALVMPILNRVLNFAVDKLPTTLQPLARQLAQRVLGIPAKEAEAEFEAAPAAPDMSAVQRQFDFEAAALLFSADEVDHETVVQEAVSGAEREDGPAVAHLHDARARFVDQLEAGVDPEQAMEQFIPAVMAVLPIARTVIGVIGRRRVVGMLAKILTGFVERYIPKEQAAQLSSAIVDAGLRMLSLETSAETEAAEPRVGYEAVAQAVEDTVRRVSELDEAVFEEPAQLEAAVTEAFHSSAAENFPPQVLVPEMHEAASIPATWVVLPRGRRRKHYYKKYTRVFDVEITPQLAESVTTFGGTKLAAVLKDQLGVVPPVRARVHLYQAIPGTTLRRIAALERTVPGLGKGAGAIQLQPLTVEVAGALLQHPKLGRNVPGSYLSARGAVAVGQRFYYLEIAGARPIFTATGSGAPAVRRMTTVNVTLDFPKDEFRVFVYLGESDAQQAAAAIRKQDLTSVLLLTKRVADAGVSVALSGDIKRHVKILSEAPHEEIFGDALKQLADSVKRLLTKKVEAWVGTAVALYMKESAGEFVAATEDPADGVTIVVTIASPPGAPIVRKLLRGEMVGGAMLAGLDALFVGQPKLSVRTVPGFRFD